MQVRTWTPCTALLVLLASVAVEAQDHVITTVAGGGPDHVPALSAGIGSLWTVAVDGSGDIFIGSLSLFRVFKLDPSGELTVVAGNGASGFSGEGGPATSASIGQPGGLAVDGDGNLFIADTSNQRVRRVDAATGLITTVAGTGAFGFGGDGGAAVDAMFNTPTGLALAPNGDLYIADSGNYRVRLVDAHHGTITTVAGTGEAGFGGDGGAATGAILLDPFGVSLTPDGRLLIADSGNHRIRQVETHGRISTIAGNGIGGFSGDGGLAIAAGLNHPEAVATDATGAIFVADVANNRIRRISEGVITTLAGTGETGFDGDGGPAAQAILNGPIGVAASASGNLFIADGSNRRIRRVEGPDALISTVAGNGEEGFSGDDVAATAASLGQPFDVALDQESNVFVADAGDARVRRVDAATGQITTVLGGDGTKPPVGLAFDSAGRLLVADPYSVRRLDTATGEAELVAGDGTQGYAGDGGPAASATFNGVLGVAVDADSDVFIADSLNNRIRRVDALSGLIATVAGNGNPGFAGDGGPGPDAQLQHPSGVGFDAAGNLYIADTYNERIRRLDAATGIITTVASGLAGPTGVMVNRDGELLIAESAGHRILKLDSAGGISTLAGSGAGGLSGDGGPALLAQLDRPLRVSADPDGNLFVADADAHRVRRIANSVPMAVVQAAVSGTGVVSLNGSTSADADGDPLAYRWTDEADTIVATTATASLTPPAGHHAYTLTVKDGRGGTSSDAASVDVSRAIEVTAPAQDKTACPIGSTQQIAWGHNLGGEGPFRIELSRDGGRSWSDIASFVPAGSDSGTYTWVVTGPHTSKAVIRVSWVPDGTVSGRSATVRIK